jgi:hypothetical protein
MSDDDRLQGRIAVLLTGNPGDGGIPGTDGTMPLLDLTDRGQRPVCPPSPYLFRDARFDIISPELD